MDFETAHEFLMTAKRIGRDQGVEVSVAVVDAAGHPVLTARGKPDAWHGPYMAAGKARLAAAFRKSTRELLEQWADRPLYAQSLTTILPDGVTLNPGGYPILDGTGRCVGAIGIGGSRPEVDDAIARQTVETMTQTETSGATPSGHVGRKRAIVTDGAPTPTGPFNQAIRIGNLVFTSGQAGRNRETGKMGDIQDQARRCIGNLRAVLEAAGAGLEDVVKATVYLRNPEDAKAFNEVYLELMPEPLPARSSAFVGLKNPDMLVEMEMVAVVQDRADRT